MCRSSERPPMLDINFNRFAPCILKTNYQQPIMLLDIYDVSELNFFFPNLPIAKAGMDRGNIHQKMNDNCHMECILNIFLRI